MFKLVKRLTSVVAMFAVLFALLQQKLWLQKSQKLLKTLRKKVL